MNLAIKQKPYPLNYGYGICLILRVLCSSRTEQHMTLLILYQIANAMACLLYSFVLHYF